MIALVRPECPNPEALTAGNYADLANKDTLRNSTFGKCMYCESKMEHVSFSHIEHIKPKSKYPELEFEWKNLGFCCERCNTNKGSKYDEALPFINPYNENPEDYLEFTDHIIWPKQGSRRGIYTIKEIDLNRNTLIDRRKDKIKDIEKMIKAIPGTSSESLRNQAITELKKEAEKDKEYSAAIKSILVAKGILSSKNFEFSR